ELNVEVARRGRVERLGEREGDGDGAGVGVRAGGGTGERDVDQSPGGDQQQRAGNELDRAERLAAGAREPRAGDAREDEQEDGERGGRRAEVTAQRAPRARLGAHVAVGEQRAGARSVDGGRDDEAHGRV